MYFPASLLVYVLTYLSTNSGVHPIYIYGVRRTSYLDW